MGSLLRAESVLAARRVETGTNAVLGTLTRPDWATQQQKHSVETSELISVLTQNQTRKHNIRNPSDCTIHATFAAKHMLPVEASELVD